MDKPSVAVNRQGNLRGD